MLNENNFLDNNASFEFNKRKRRDSNGSCNYQDEQELNLRSSFEDLHSQDNFNQTKFSGLIKNYSASNLKSPNGSLASEKKIGTLETMLKDTASSNTVVVQKKERKKKKTELVVDSNKNVTLSPMMISNMQLMPPPTSTTMITSLSTMTGLITANSPTSSTSTTNTYGFVDLDHQANQQIASPALRPITLNVKSSSSMNNSNNNNLTNVTSIKVSDKNLTNKLKQGSPKASAAESDFNIPSYSPKSSPKLSKSSKQSKQTINTSSANSYNATSPKNPQTLTKLQQQQHQSSKLKSTGLTIIKTSASSSPISISPPTSASPLSPKAQNPLITLNNNNKIMQAKKSKGSLNAVIDKLRVNATSSSNDDNNLLSSLNASLTTGSKDASQLNLPNEIVFTKNELNKSDVLSALSAASLNKLNAIQTNLSKLNESKNKYTKPEINRDYTVKQSSGGLKFTLTKTTKSPLLEAKTKNSNINSSSKLPITTAKNLSSSLNSSSITTSSSSLFQQQLQKQSATKTSTGIKRQLNASTNFKPGQQGNKSSSSSLTKSLSPESADQILEAALPKVHLDKLPKIPKTLNSQSSFSQQQTSQQQQASQSTASQTIQQSQIKNNLQAKFLQQQHLKQQNLLRQQLNSINANNQLHFRKFNTNQSGRQIDLINQTATSDNNTRDFSSSNNQSKTSNNDSQQQQQAAAALHQQTNLSFSQQLDESQNKNEFNKSSTINKFNTQNKNKSSANLNTSITSTQTTQPSSLSITVNPSSTPSSPMECNVIPDVYQKSPPLIPTETIEETASPSIVNTSTANSQSSSFQKTTPTKIFDLPNVQKRSSLESTIAKLSADKQLSISSFNLMPSPSKLVATTAAEVKKVFIDDEDDEERLFIDDEASDSKKNSSSISSKVN